MSVEDELRRWIESIRGVRCYTERIKIYAPTCYGKCLDAVERLIGEVNRVLRGSTVYDATGSWVEDGRVVTEPVKVIEVGHHCLKREEARKIAEAITRYAEETKQQEIAIYAGSFYLAERPAMLEAYKKLIKMAPE